jgi:hypothetical protein
MEVKSTKTYNQTSYEKRKGEGRKVCSICFGTYTYFNKSHHNKTDRHLRALNAKTLCLDQLTMEKNTQWTLDEGSDGTASE